MSWETLLKKRKKINLSLVKNIAKEILDREDPPQFAISSLTDMVVPIYLERTDVYTKRTRGIKQLLSQSLPNMGYYRVDAQTKVRTCYLIKGRKQGMFYVKEGVNVPKKERKYSYLKLRGENNG